MTPRYRVMIAKTLWMMNCNLIYSWGGSRFCSCEYIQCLRLSLRKGKTEREIKKKIVYLFRMGNQDMSMANSSTLNTQGRDVEGTPGQKEAGI